MSDRSNQRIGPSARQLAKGLAGAQAPARIALAEGEDDRVRQAAAVLPDLGISPLVITTTATAKKPASPGVFRMGVEELSRGPAGDLVWQGAAQRNWPPELAEQRRRDPVYLAAALVALGEADGAVAGCRHPTAHVIRAGLHMIGLATGCASLSSSFLLILPSGAAVAFADCAVVPEPDTEQLAEIAEATAGTFTALTGEKSSVAMLSFSTLGSADHPSVTRVREATALVKRRNGDFAIDGELQFDAAFVDSVASEKAPESEVAGRANVFVFPNLAAGNIGYKIAQRLGGAEAFGPILQGLRSPMNDLSRGCSAEDVVSVAVITALQARVG